MRYIGGFYRSSSTKRRAPRPLSLFLSFLFLHRIYTNSGFLSSGSFRHFKPTPVPIVLELKDITLELPSGNDETKLLEGVNLHIPRAHFAAIIGPSGCGKSTLLKLIAGIKEHTEGSIHWDERDLSHEGDMRPDEIGYVPQFSIAHELLTVEECIESALKLRVRGLSPDEFEARLDRVFKEVTLEEIADRRVALLSGGQKRRLSMAMEMVSSPLLFLCDEVTSGLDPLSEDEIVKLMHGLSRKEDRVVLSVTHSLRHLSLYDSVVVLYQGRLAYHGLASALTHYFGIDKPEDLYPRLAQRRASEWHRSWEKHKTAYYEQAKLTTDSKSAADSTPEQKQYIEHSPTTPDETRSMAETRRIERPGKKKKEKPPEDKPHTSTPNPFSQFVTLLTRRWKLFFRDKGQLILQLALLFGFPCIVVLFALDGLPAIKSLSTPHIGSTFEKITAQAGISQDIAKSGGLVSGLIMFQVILLALMGSNNSAREIASERLILEKEKFAGLSPLAYIMSKTVFLGLIILAQSIWMTVFVNQVVGFPGSIVDQALQLILVNAALTFTCLGISAWARTAEQSSLLSIYLVGFQLPLSGAVLALPKMIAGVSQFFVASYWGWSGFIKAMRDTPYYGAAASVTQTNLQESKLCLWVLIAHCILGIIIAYTGAKNSRWE